MNLEHVTPELVTALAKAQTELGNAAKNAKNPHFRSDYADLGQILATVKPVLSAHNIALLQSTEFDGRMVSVTTTLAHGSGGYITSIASCVPAKTDAQGIGAATTYLRRYGAAAMTGIGQEDDDGQSATHNREPAPLEDVPSPLELHKQAFEANFEAISAAKVAINKGDWAAVVDATQQIPDEDKKALWAIAPSKGGVAWTTAERKALHSDEYNAARHEWFAQQGGKVA
jgi:hypothetical protein